jgi:hypothetical protein
MFKNFLFPHALDIANLIPFDFMTAVPVTPRTQQVSKLVSFRFCKLLSAIVPSP